MRCARVANERVATHAVPQIEDTHGYLAQFIGGTSIEETGKNLERAGIGIRWGCLEEMDLGLNQLAGELPG